MRRILALSGALLLTAALWLMAVPPGPEPTSTSLRAGALYGVTIAVRDLASITQPTTVSIGDAKGILAQKQLHAFDPDFYFTFRARVAGSLQIKAPAGFTTSIAGITTAKISEQRTRWQDAQRIRLNEVIGGAADDRLYIPIAQKPEELTQGQHWFQFTAERTELAFFAIETPNGDVPADIDVFIENAGSIEPYAEGSHGYVPEATQNFPGRWLGNENSTEYQTLLRWIRGAGSGGARASLR